VASQGAGAFELGQHVAKRRATARVFDSVGEHEEQPFIRGRPQQVTEQREGGGIRPVQVVDDHDDRAIPAELPQQGHRRVGKRFCAALRGAVDLARATRRQFGQQCCECCAAGSRCG